MTLQAHKFNLQFKTIPHMKKRTAHELTIRLTPQLDASKLPAELRTALAIILNEVQAHATPWRTREGAAEYLHATPSTVDRMVQQGRLKRHYLNGVPRFHRNDLDACFSEEKDGLRLFEHEEAKSV
jgi:hypothetical protein